MTLQAKNGFHPFLVSDQPAGHEEEHEREYLPQAVPSAQRGHSAAGARREGRGDQRREAQGTAEDHA